LPSLGSTICNWQVFPAFHLNTQGLHRANKNEQCWGYLHWNSWRMRKLLLLLPALALTSCSSGHDLMSDKTSQLKCKAPMPGVSAVLTVSPLLPQATVVVSNAEQPIEGL